MTSSLERRTFVKAAAATAGTLAVAGLAGCSPASQNGPTNKQGKPEGGRMKGKRGEGKPQFKGSMNRAQKVDTAPPDDEALARFVVVSDTHLANNYEPYTERVQNFFEDVAQNISDIDSIIVNGDITQHGLLEEYNTFATLAEANGFAYPDDFMLIIGNHDQYDSTEGAEPVSNLSDRFKEQAKLVNQIHPYYDRTINGVHMVALGPDRYPNGNWAHFGISDEQATWLDNLALADKEASTLTFVFLHEPLYKTVRQTDPGDFGHEWSLSSEDNDNLHEHISRHENVVFFTGHTHALPDTVQLDGDDPLFVGTGSVAYCVDDPNTDDSGYAEIDVYGSYGWEVTVWTTCVRFRLRNFLKREWADEMGTAIYQF